MKKTCKECGQTKPLSEFRIIFQPGGRKRDGPLRASIRGRCRACEVARTSRYVREQRQANPSLRRRQRAQGKAKQLGTTVEQVYAQQCLGLRLGWAEWVPVKVDKRSFGYANGKRVKYPSHFYTLSQAERYRWKYRNDPEFNLQQRLRASLRKHRRFGCINSRLRQTLNGSGKYAELYALLGYTLTDLRAHLEQTMSDDMTWQAFLDGHIHIDHIKPLKLFDLADEQQVVEAWALSNLQLLWAEDNLRKAASYA